MRVWGVVGALCAAVIGGAVVAGCGTQPVEGQAGAEGASAREPAAGEPAFSPCDDIPDDTLRAAGVDPATESRDILGVEYPGFNVCSWDGPGYFVGIFATKNSMEEIRSNVRNEAFDEVTVGQRSAVTYREVSDLDRRRCDVAVDSADGVVLVNIMFPGVEAVTEEPCLLAVRTASALDEHLPG